MYFYNSIVKRQITTNEPDYSQRFKTKICQILPGLLLTRPEVICSPQPPTPVAWRFLPVRYRAGTLETSSIRFFMGKCKLQNSESHVTTVLRSRVRFEWQEGLPAVSAM